MKAQRQQSRGSRAAGRAIQTRAGSSAEPGPGCRHSIAAGCAQRHRREPAQSCYLLFPMRQGQTTASTGRVKATPPRECRQIQPCLSLGDALLRCFGPWDFGQRDLRVDYLLIVPGHKPFRAALSPAFHRSLYTVFQKQTQCIPCINCEAKSDMHRQSLKPASLYHNLPCLRFTSPLYRHKLLLFHSRLSGGDGNRQLLILCHVHLQCCLTRNIIYYSCER